VYKQVLSAGAFTNLEAKAFEIQNLGHQQKFILVAID
jgi:hypothetical protein